MALAASLTWRSSPETSSSPGPLPSLIAARMLVRSLLILFGESRKERYPLPDVVAVPEDRCYGGGRRFRSPVGGLRSLPVISSAPTSGFFRSTHSRISRLS